MHFLNAGEKKKLSKSGEISDFAIFDFFLAKGQMLSDLNSETRFGILSSFHNFIIPVGSDLQFLAR